MWLSEGRSPSVGVLRPSGTAGGASFLARRASTLMNRHIPIA
jgi:hypothetical protein